MRCPRAQESLTVITAAEEFAGTFKLIVEENIVLLFRSAPAAGGTSRAAIGISTRSSANAAVVTVADTFAGRVRAAVALRFVEQPQAFHQQSRSEERRGCVC